MNRFVPFIWLLGCGLLGCGGDKKVVSGSPDLAMTVINDLAMKPDAAQPLDPADGPGVFAAVGNHVHHLRSLDDGVTWVDEATDIDESQMGDQIGIRSVAFGNHQFVAFAAKILTSPDAQTWTEVRPDGQWLASMVYAQGQYVSSGGYGWLATATTDLSMWEQHPPVMDYTSAHHSQRALSHGLVYGADAYVVVDDLGVIYRSTDGKSWLPTTGVAPVPAGNTWGTAFAFGNEVFVGLLPDGMSTIVSNDAGATWTQNVAFANHVQGIVFAQGRFTLVGAGHVITSTDGHTWVDTASPSALASDIAYGHGVYLAVTGNNIYRSTDGGLSWSLSHDNAGNVDGIGAIAFGPN